MSPTTRKITRTSATLSLLLSLASCTTSTPTQNSSIPPEKSPTPTTTPTESPATQEAATPNPQNIEIVRRIVDEPTRRVVQLHNGLTIILQQNKTAPTVAARIYVKAGSLTEQEFMGCGISHVLEHLVAGATSKKVKEAQSNQMLQVLGGDSNANTSFERTCYYITTTSEKWPDALNLMANWTTGADFTPAQFAREYQVVQRELEMGEATPNTIFGEMIYATRYLTSPAKYPVIGFRQAFQKLTWQDARTYYNRMYVPDNMVVSIAGDIDLDAAQAIVQKAFAAVDRKKVPAIALPQEGPVVTTRTSVAHADVPQARADWAFATVDMSSDDMYALDVLADVLGAGESSILVRSLRDDKQLVTSISASDDTPHFAPGSLDIIAELPPGKLLTTQEEVLKILEKIKTAGIDPAAVENAKAQVAAQLVYGDQTAEQQADRNGEDYLSTGDINFSRVYVDRIKQVTAAQVQAAANKYIRPDRLLTTILLPLATPDTVLSRIKATDNTTTQEAAKLITLPNGLRVLLRRNPSSPIVTMQYYTLGALLAEDASNNGIGNAMMQMLPRGTQSRTHDEISDFFDATGGNFDASMGNNSFVVKATTLKENAPQTFEIFSDVILHPAFRPEQLDQLRDQLNAGIDASTEDWFGEGYKFLRQNFYQDSPYSRLPVGTKTEVAHLTVDQLREHYNNYFVDPAKTVVAIYGDIDVAQATQWAQRFADLPAHQVDLAKTSTPAGGKTVTQPSQKGSATVFIGYGPGMTVTSDDRFAMTILQTILGGYNAPFGSVLFETLRGKGLVYVVEAENVAGPVPGMFMVLALGEPRNGPEITKIIQQIINNAKAGGITDLQIQTAKDQAVTGEQLSAQTIEELAADEAIDELMGLGYTERDHFADNIRKVTKADVIRVANKYLNDPVIAISSPAAK